MFSFMRPPSGLGRIDEDEEGFGDSFQSLWSFSILLIARSKGRKGTVGSWKDGFDVAEDYHLDDKNVLTFVLVDSRRTEFMQQARKGRSCFAFTELVEAG